MRKAASLIICSPLPGSTNFRVLLLQRSNHGFYGGLAVFPGGAITTSDGNPDWHCFLPKIQRPWFSTHLSYAIGAIRETFEESGLLLLQPEWEWEASQMVLTEGRKKVMDDPSHFITFCRKQLRVPSTDRLVYWSNWISPVHHTTRFDTHFFLTTIQQSQMNQISADGRETLSALWMTPIEALQAFANQGNYR